MIEHIGYKGAVAFVTSGIAGTVVAGAVATAEVILGADSLIPLGVFVIGVGGVGGLAWRAGVAFTELRDEVKNIGRRVEAIERAHEREKA